MDEKKEAHVGFDDVVLEDLEHADEVQLSTGEVVNASGHVQEVQRNFGLWSLICTAIVTGCAWPAIGGTLVVALYDGGSPGVIYEFIAVSFCYGFVYASIAELGSAIPSSAGVYHFASVTAGKYSKPVSFWAGWWNCFAYIFGCASVSAIQGNLIVSMWALFHPDYVYQRWHVFIVYIIITWICASVVLFGNSLLPRLAQLGGFFIIAGVLVTVLVCAIMPSQTGTGYASSYDVWANWQNQTGWTSDGFVFLIGMLNGAYAIGTPDVVVHLAEEMPLPRRNIPKAIAAQFTIALSTALIYLIAVLFAITDLDAVFNTTFPIPIAEAYRQATSTRGGSLGLLLVIFSPTIMMNTGTFITASRMLWTLARDDASPLSKQLGRIHGTFHNPFNAIFACACITTVLGAIYVGSTAAFNAIVGAFVILSSLSFVSAILPHLLSGRVHVKPGPFWMKGAFGKVVHSVSSAYIVVFVVIFCFPYAMPVDAASMNYSCLITGGLSLLIGLLYLWKRQHGYVGPKVLLAQ